ncbi:MAG: hypothetical protein WCO06_07215 [Candidatus Roizmanbacteria bacterium]
MDIENRLMDGLSHYEDPFYASLSNRELAELLHDPEYKRYYSDIVRESLSKLYGIKSNPQTTWRVSLPDESIGGKNLSSPIPQVMVYLSRTDMQRILTSLGDFKRKPINDVYAQEGMQIGSNLSLLRIKGINHKIIKKLGRNGIMFAVARTEKLTDDICIDVPFYTIRAMTNEPPLYLFVLQGYNDTTSSPEAPLFSFDPSSPSLESDILTRLMLYLNPEVLKREGYEINVDNNRLTIIPK